MWLPSLGGQTRCICSLAINNKDTSPKNRWRLGFENSDGNASNYQTVWLSQRRAGKPYLSGGGLKI